MSEHRRFVVATHAFLLVVAVDGQWRLADLQVLARGHHYGVALPQADGRSFLAKGRGEVLTSYQRNGRPDASYHPGQEVPLSARFSQVHQIVYWQDMIFLTNTARNSLVWISPQGEEIGRYHFDGADEDIHHVNSIFPLQDGTLACLLHWRARRPSEIALMRLRQRSQIELVHRGPIWHLGCHNIYIDRQRLIYNASAAGKMVVVDVNRGRIEAELDFPGHTKGLSVLDQHYVIGYSDHAEREQRKRSRGYLAVIRRESLAVEAVIDLNHPSLPHAAGNVNEIRCLSQREYGHHAGDGEGLAASLQRLTSHSLPGRLWLAARLQAVRALQIGRSHWQRSPAGS